MDATIEPAHKEMEKLGKSYVAHIYTGAGHGFLRQQDGQNGANLNAGQKAWPATVEFFKEHTR